MPNTLYGDEPNGILKQVAIGVITAAILGVWAFATTIQPDALLFAALATAAKWRVGEFT